MVSPRDIVIEVRDGNFRRVGQVDVGVVGDGKFVKRKDAVGAWQMTLPNEHPMIVPLKTPKSGVLVWLAGDVYLSGPMTAWTTTTSSDDPEGTTTFTGVDDMVVFADHLAWPQPSNADPDTQTVANDNRTGPVETLVKGYLSDNVGPNAPAARRDGLTSRLTIEPDTGRGQTVSGSPRFQVLGELCASLTGVDGALGFDVVQVNGGTALVLSVYAVADRTKTVRMDVDNDLLSSSQSGVSAPIVTHPIVAGQGEGVDRQLYLVTDDLSVAASNTWGRKVESFIDQRQTSDITELQQAGLKALADGGRTVVSLKVVPADMDTMQYGTDWGVGDRVGVVVAGQVLADVVSEAVLSVDDSDVKVGATVGDPIGYDWEASVTAGIRDVRSRVALLERAL